MLYWLTRTAQRLAGGMPRPLRWWLGEIVAQAIYWLWAEKRRATQLNMSIVLGLPRDHPQVRRTARLSWRNYGHYIGDLFDLPNHPVSFYLDDLDDQTPGDLGALDTVDAERARGRGVLIVSGHYGNWDVAGMLLASRRPIYALAEMFKDPRMNDLLQSQRRAMGLIITPADGEGLRVLLKALRAGEVAASPVDRPMPPGEGVAVTFFGRTAYVPRALGAMAAKLGVVLIPGFVWYRADGGLAARIFPPMPLDRAADSETETRRATQAMFDGLEAIVRQDPTQWFMFRPMWPADDAAPAPPPRPAATVTAEGGRDARNG